MLFTSNLARNLVKSTLVNGKRTSLKCLSTTSTTRSGSNEQTAPTSPETQPASAESVEVKSLKETLLTKDNEVKDLKDKYMRALAEAENVRTRMMKQVDDAKIFGIQGFCKDLLEVADVLNLAIENTNPNKTNVNPAANASEQLNSMFNGLVMTEKSLLKIFEKHGLTQIKPAKGDAFDPNLHDAIFRVPDEESKSGTVFTSTKTGFILRGRVIRAAQVGVVQ
jgi:molecular chaperone GrpE